MPTRLARWVCVLTALAAGSAFAADKPKEKKDKPATGGIGAGIGAVIGQATGSPKTGAVVGGLLGAGTGTLLGPDAAAQAPTEKFVITKPVGTWFKDVRHEDYVFRIVLKVQEDRLTVECVVTDGKDRATLRLDADYAINREGCLYGVIDTFESNFPQITELTESQKLSGQPYSFRFRADGNSLSLKEFKGFGICWSSDASPEGLKRVISSLCGRYTAVDPDKPLPPLTRSAEDIKRSEEKEERERDRWRRLAPTLLRVDEFKTPKAEPEQKTTDDTTRPIEPRAITPERIHGGLLKADLPCDGGTQPTTSTYAGPIGGAVAVPSRSDAAVVQAKSEVSATEPPRLIPTLREDDCPKCDDPPSDAEVMRRFNEKQVKGAGPDYEAIHDDIVIVKNLVTDKIDAPRFYPLAGVGRSQCCRWDCAVYFRDTKAGKPKVEVISFETSTVRMVVPASDTAIPQRMMEK